MEPYTFADLIRIARQEVQFSLAKRTRQDRDDHELIEATIIAVVADQLRKLGTNRLLWIAMCCPKLLAERIPQAVWEADCPEEDHIVPDAREWSPDQLIRTNLEEALGAVLKDEFLPQPYRGLTGLPITTWSDDGPRTERVDPLRVA